MNLFEHNNYTVNKIEDPESFGNGAYGNYGVYNTDTETTELLVATFVQAVSACIELSNHQKELTEYLNKDNAVYEPATTH